MSLLDPLDLEATAPVGAWNARLGVDTPGVFKALLKGTVSAYTGNAPGAVSSAIDGLFSFKVKERPTPGELAWLLIRRSLEQSMTELAIEAVRRRGLFIEEGELEEPTARLDGQLASATIPIGTEFFERPGEHPVVETVRGPFAEWLVAIGLTPAEAASVNRRLPAYFTLALRREWATRAEVYAPLEAELQKRKTPFALADARERAWMRNAAWLQRQVDEPVFEEAFGLAEVYVPLHAWYRRVAKEERPRRHVPEEAGPDEEQRIVVDLERCLDRWLDAADPKDPVRVICGGPGSGKTSFAKMWAAKLAGETRRVLFVPLHRLELRHEVPDVQAAMWEYLRIQKILPADPLEVDGEPRLLILFDGLDELAMQGRAGQEVARSFVVAVTKKLDLLNDRRDGRLVQVVLGGRDIAVQATALPAHQILHVLPYHGTDPEEFAEGRELLDEPRYGCDRWWRQFGEAVGDSYDGLPEPLRGRDLAEITAQPLLNYLLALSYRRGELDFSAAPNLNLIYADLLDAVYERKWGPRRHPTADALSHADFNALLDELGLAAWHGNRRIIAETEVERACERAGLRRELERLKEAREGAISLLAAFYFRQAGRLEGGERTFEFTHKSFGEYLVTRRLVRWIGTIHKMRALRRSDRDLGWGEEEALVKWIEAAGPAPIDRDVLAFMIREVEVTARDDRDRVSAWRQTLAELLSDQLRHALPMHKAGQPTFQEMTRQGRNAEEGLLAAHFCCASAVQEHSLIDWPSPYSLRDLIARMDQEQAWPSGRACLAWLGMTEDALGHILLQSNLERANLERANLERANLEGAILKSVNLVQANLKGANLEGANLEGANLCRTTLEEAKLAWASLRAANLQGANLDQANLEGAKLDRAELEEANLRRANLEETKLRAARLDKANLDGANLEGANLRGASLVGTNLLTANLERAKLENARIERKWVERLKLDAERLGLEVVDDRDEEQPAA